MAYRQPEALDPALTAQIMAALGMKDTFNFDYGENAADPNWGRKPPKLNSLTDALDAALKKNEPPPKADTAQETKAMPVSMQTKMPGFSGMGQAQPRAQTSWAGAGRADNGQGGTITAPRRPPQTGGVGVDQYGRRVPVAGGWPSPQGAGAQPQSPSNPFGGDAIQPGQPFAQPQQGGTVPFPQGIQPVIGSTPHPQTPRPSVPNGISDTVGGAGQATPYQPSSPPPAAPSPMMPPNGGTLPVIQSPPQQGGMEMPPIGWAPGDGSGMVDGPQQGGMPSNPDDLLAMLFGGGQSGMTQPKPAAGIYGNPAAFQRSDIRLKSNIQRVGTHPLGVGVYDYDIDGRRERGVMAQELMHVLPTAVRVGGDGYFQVDYSRL